MSITRKQADELYPYVDQIAERAQAICNDILSNLNDPDIKGDERASYMDDLVAYLGDLQADWDELTAAVVKLKLPWKT